MRKNSDKQHAGVAKTNQKIRCPDQPSTRPNRMAPFARALMALALLAVTLPVAAQNANCAAANCANASGSAVMSPDVAQVMSLTVPAKGARDADEPIRDFSVDGASAPLNSASFNYELSLFWMALGLVLMAAFRFGRSEGPEKRFS